jgi:hypothetical protein
MRIGVFMKQFLSLTSFVLATIVMVSCGTIQNAPPYTYTGDKAIYPAVYHAIANGNQSSWVNSKAAVPDPNTVVINNVQISDGLRMADFTLRISLVNNVVTYQFSNIRQRPISETIWTPVERFFYFFRELIFTSYFNTEIPKVMENEDLYAQAKEAADKSLGGAPGSGNSPGGTSGNVALSFTLPLQNPQNYLLYPAVGAAFNSIKGSLGAKTANIWDVFCLDNEFTIQGCVAERRLFDIISYHIKISVKDNQLNIEFINIGPIGTAIMQYSDAEVESLPKFDTQKIADQLKAQIERNLASAGVYNEAKKAFLANNAFLSRALVPITRVMMDEFVSKVLKGGEIGLSVSISDVKKNENSEFKNYTTVITASLFTDPPVSRIFAGLTLYTSDASLARLRQNETITLSGQLVRMEYSAGGSRFIMTK